MIEDEINKFFCNILKNIGLYDWKVYKTNSCTETEVPVVLRFVMQTLQDPPVSSSEVSFNHNIIALIIILNA